MGKIGLTVYVERENVDEVLDLVEGFDEEKTTKSKKSSKKKDEEEEEEEEDDKKSKKSKSKKGKKDEEEEDDDDNDDDDNDDEDEDDKKSKKSKSKKKDGPSMDDVIAAFRSYSEKHSREKAIKILNKEYDVSSVADLDKEDYADVIERLKKK